MKSLFLKPFPAEFSLKRISFHAWLGFSIVFFILFFIQPFEINELSTLEAFKIAFAYAIVCPIVIYPLELILTRCFPHYYDEKNWNVGKHILNHLMVVVFIAIGNSIMTAFLFDTSVSLYQIVGFIKYTLLIGFFPLVIGVLFSQYQNQKKYLKLSQQLNTKLEKSNDTTDISDTLVQSDHIQGMPDALVSENIAKDKDIPIKLLGQNNNEFLMVKPSQIIYLMAADNYVAVHYLVQSQKKVLLRSTLTLLYTQLSDYGIFIKCHRSYIVNKELILSVSGNAQGLKLKLQNVAEEIPVSRMLNKDFLAYF
jgi:hypothetical protein